jgi:hypothetical protein
VEKFQLAIREVSCVRQRIDLLYFLREYAEKKSSVCPIIEKTERALKELCTRWASHSTLALYRAVSTTILRRCSQILRGLITLRKLVGSPNFVKLLEIVLAVGNYMNGGSFRGGVTRAIAVDAMGHL